RSDGSPARHRAHGIRLQRKRKGRAAPPRQVAPICCKMSAGANPSRPRRRFMSREKKVWSRALAALGALVLCVSLVAQPPVAPKFKFDPDWPKPLPNKWKLGGVTGLAVDKDDNVWVLNRPNDLTDIELEAELTPPLADCCVRPPAMIHIDKNGNVIGSFDAPQGHGMAVDTKGFIYIGQDTVRKYDPKTGKVVAAVPR